MTRIQAAVAALIFTVIGAARIASTYGVFSHTIDEPDHLAAGMQWLDAGKYTYEDQHPPLARIFGAVGPYLAGERWRRDSDPYFEGYRILGFDAHYDRVLSLGRAGILPFFFIASAVVFLWGERAGGSWAALFSVFLFTTLPPVLAHAGLLTTDMAATACTGAAALASLYWLDCPSKARAIQLGMWIAFAALAKFSCLPFLFAFWLLMYAIRRKSVPWRPAVMVLSAAAFLIWAGYRFSFARVEFLHLRLPAARFFLGLHSLWNHNREGHLSYVVGRTSMSGFWYYFPVVLAVKTPIALMALAGWSLGYLRKREVLLPLSFSLAILTVASCARINIGVRHVLPIYIGLCVAAGVVAAHTRWHYIAALLMAWQAFAGFNKHPDYLSYTNEVAGSHPERWVVDSDLDWGQDMNRLQRRLLQAGAPQLAFTPFNRTYSARAGHHLPPMTPTDPDKPLPGWNAVSVTIWKLYGIPHWVENAPPPTERIGDSILLWKVPPGVQ